MDKLFNKTWFIKLTSLIIAILLFLMVNMDDTVNRPGGIPGVTDGSKVLEEVELNVYYDEDNYVLTEAPETVQVTLRGPQNVLTLAQITQPRQDIYIDLTDKGAGTHYERVQHSGFQSDLSLSIVPNTVQVTLQEKRTASYPVEVNLENEGQMEEGYVVGNPTVNPSSVEVTAAEGIIEQIAYARASIDLAEVDQSVEQSVPVVFYNENGVELDLNATPPAVEVLVPVTSPNKEVPLRLDREGELPEGVAIDSISTEPEDVTIYGPIDIINEISFIDMSAIDLSHINGDTSFDLEVPVPDGVERVDPKTVQVNVETTVEEESEFSDFEIEVEGLREEQTFEFINPEEGQFDLVVKGSPDLLDRLERSDLQAVVDVEDFSDGEHEAPLELNGQQNIRFDQQGMMVTFIISEPGTVENFSESNENNNEAEENEGNESNEGNDSNESIEVIEEENEGIESNEDTLDSQDEEENTS